MSVTLADIAEQAIKHLGEPGPDNSCVSNGLERWTHELGLPGLGTASVSEARRLARAGHNGWTYRTGTNGLAVGCFVDWDPEILGDSADAHVSCVTELARQGVKSIGSGGPTGKVAYQPKSGGFNPTDYFIGYFVPPLKQATASSSSRPTPASSSTYTVQRGDNLIRIAARHHTSTQAILRANPPAADRVTRDYHITHAGFILAGQKLHIPG